MRIISILGSEIGIISDRIAGLMPSHDKVIGRLENVPGIGSKQKKQEIDNLIKEKAIMNGIDRKDIKIGLRVSIVLKQDQRTGKLTEGIVKDILTKSPTHPHGIKVRLENGSVGRVQKIDSTSH